MKLTLCMAADGIELAGHAVTKVAMRAARGAMRVSDAMFAMSAWLRISGTRDRAVALLRGVCPPGIKMCSAQQRRRTPRAFAEWLIVLAKMARVQEAQSA